ncbi:MAG: DUF4402 domain-containing protein [Pseudomonadota bacterium]
MRIAVGLAPVLRLAAVLSVMSYGAANAEVSEASNAGARIVEPLMVMAWEELDFGIIAPGTTLPGTVTVTANQTRSCGPEVDCIGNEFAAARFMVTGESGHVYDISVPTGLTIENSTGDQMIIDNLYSDISQGLLVDGVDEFWVGGDLHIAANQAPGAYTGAYIVSVQYQ